MTTELALLLAQDGIANGAIYVLVALGIVLIFLVTRVIFVPFGDLVAWPRSRSRRCRRGGARARWWLVLVLAVLALCFEAVALLRAGAAHRLPRAVLLWLVLPACRCSPPG